MKTLDAKNKKIGRIASVAARMLMGKDEADYTPNKDKNTKVQIINASKAKIDFKKLRDTKYTRYSGYASGLKEESMQDVIKKKGYAEVFRKAVSGMLPKNTLKNNRMKNLEIID
ncbi:MAG TPA: 50S ribosomal protein L13 [Candidatus Paceibacterota bacterium]|nr:50S ribosomal protein L13 [Candidatus Paceibacterota bacterium]